ncbi:hypothetical protein I7I53_03572 [Histoplasma capsulatum var. duboisii H88]|uniref:Uncharacterized protein n=1 Tax=Ajellomyces capsulatus (strain H88) TaxID=544711 RepID=A0A8A1LR98_AJEC8|nr:hypothetical protein I7I53_03572 [Histoplasma capsulatum var. duboisii H88]
MHGYGSKTQKRMRGQEGGPFISHRRIPEYKNSKNSPSICGWRTYIYLAPLFTFHEGQKEARSQKGPTKINWGLVSKGLPEDRRRSKHVSQQQAAKK